MQIFWFPSPISSKVTIITYNKHMSKNQTISLIQACDWNLHVNEELLEAISMHDTARDDTLKVTLKVCL